MSTQNLWAVGNDRGGLPQKLEGAREISYDAFHAAFPDIFFFVPSSAFPASPLRFFEKGNRLTVLVNSNEIAVLGHFPLQMKRDLTFSPARDGTWFFSADIHRFLPEALKNQASALTPTATKPDGMSDELFQKVTEYWRINRPSLKMTRKNKAAGG